LRAHDSAEPLLFLQKYFSVLTFDEENRSRNIKYRDLFSRAATSNTVLRLTSHRWLAMMGFLCVGCIERRLGRQLTKADFASVPINSDRRHRSKRLRNRLTSEATAIARAGQMMPPV
jgi:hypothetical protein